MMNTFGNILRLSTFGESHGPAIGGIIDGFPAGIDIDIDFIRQQMQRRRPGTSLQTTQRNEADEVEILSGVFEGKSTGCPIGFVIKNTDAHSVDYSEMKDLFRPSHADFTYQTKYGIRDCRGGGRTSARETACRVVGGAFAQMLTRKAGIDIKARIAQVGNTILTGTDEEQMRQYNEAVDEVRRQNDSIGGIITCNISGCPVGLGEPVFGKLHAALGAAMLSINAAKGFDYGEGFSGIGMRGSEQNDPFVATDGKIHTTTNHSGGIQGGISNGEDIYFRVAFKPVATIAQEQHTVNKQGEPTTLKAKGRHDPCVLQRALPIVESMAALVIADYMLLNHSATLFR
ncbi:MAG: chorismate synthase [Bacteroidaceae bacterium]|nr:chorismate synthase [Bacteroidaceae bacterium]